MDKLKYRGYSCSLYLDDSSDLHSIEKKIMSSVVLVAILTANCLKRKEFMFAIQAALHHYHSVSRILLVKELNFHVVSKRKLKVHFQLSFRNNMKIPFFFLCRSMMQKVVHFQFHQSPSLLHSLKKQSPFFDVTRTKDSIKLLPNTLQRR